MRQPTRRPPRTGPSRPPHNRNPRGESNKPEEDPNLPQALERGDHHAEQEQPTDYLEDDAHEARTLATAVAVGRLASVMGQTAGERDPYQRRRFLECGLQPF